MNTKHLLIYNYVFINVTSDSILLYNAISGKSITSTNSTFIGLFKDKDLNSDYIVTLNDNIKDKEYINNILNELENNFFAQIINTSNTSNLPLNFSPILDVYGYNFELYRESYITFNLDESKRVIFDEAIGKNIVNNLLEITIHFNSLEKPIPPLEKAHLQYPFPIINNYCEVNFKQITIFFEQEMPALNRVNIIAGEVNKENTGKINELIDYFNNKAKIYFYSIYDNYHNISDIRINNNSVYLWLLPSNLPNLVNNNSNYNLIGLSTNAAEEEILIRLQEFNKILEYYPLFTGDNDIYCKNTMGFQKEDTLSLNLDEKAIFSNKTFNSNFFGEITISPNGDIYTCINKKPIGNINTDNLKKILFDEFSIYKNWFLIRGDIPKCKDCIYNFICPPITNFELCLNSVDLCI